MSHKTANNLLLMCYILTLKISLSVCVYTFQFADKGGTDLELVTCSGHGKNGALCILQVYTYMYEHTHTVHTPLVQLDTFPCLSLTMYEPHLEECQASGSDHL